VVTAGVEQVGGAPLATGTLACVIDGSPERGLAALRWFAAATGVAGIDASMLRVHCAGEIDRELAALLRGAGVAVRRVNPFERRSGPCDRIAGALELAAAGPRGLCVLTDADTVVLDDPRAVPVADDAVGVGEGGLYLVPSPIVGDVARAWAWWARWLLDRTVVHERGRQPVDRAAMSLALGAEGIEAVALDPRWSVIVRSGDGRAAGTPPRVSALHYEGRVDAIGHIRPIGDPVVDAAVAAANGATAQVWRTAFPNAAFWNWRYATNPGLGSGVGSRDEPLSEKRALLAEVLAAVRPERLLDVGCGDGEATRCLDVPAYVGVDVSSEAIDRARRARPAGRYLVGGPPELDLPPAEIVLCLDVLIHQPDPERYRAVVASLLGAATEALVISGYESATHPSPMVFFHEPLSATIRAQRPDLEVHAVRQVHDVTTLLVFDGRKPGPRAEALRELVGGRAGAGGAWRRRSC
jgi:SAM-dependent methyltransferase